MSLRSILRQHPGVARLVAALLLLVMVWFVTTHAITAIAAMNCLTWAGYWIVLAAFVTLICAFAKTLPPLWRAQTWTMADRWSALAVVLGGVVLLVHEPPGFKILMDEIQLLGTSMAMHWERAVFVPQRAHELEGVFELMAGQVDKRPLFFPFLLCGVHDLTGYRPENAFILNGVLTFVLLGLCYTAGRALSGDWRGGLLSVAALSSLPLLGQNASGGGFELLNLVMILGTAVLAAWHYRRRDSYSLTALVYAGLLLAQTRYESPLFLLAVAAVIGLVWWEQRQIQLPWQVVLSPLALSPVFLMSRVFEARPSSWEMASRPGYDVAFSVRNIPENISHALAFWFNTGVEQPNSPLLAGLGLIAVIGALVALPRLVRKWPALSVGTKVGILFGAALLLHFGLMMCYFWGKFDDPVIRRLSLPTHLLFALALPFTASLLPQPARWLKWGLVVACIGVLATGLPGMARRSATRLYYPAMETAWRREFIRAWPERDYLVIDNDNSIWITHLVSSTPIVRAKSEPALIGFNLRNRLFSSIYVFQRFDIDEATGVLKLKPDDDLGPAYELETIAERSFTTTTLSRLSRLKAIHLGEQKEITALAIPSGPTAKPSGTPVPREQREAEFFKEWLKMLP